MYYYSTDVSEVENRLYELSEDPEYKGTFTYITNQVEKTPWWITMLPDLLLVLLLIVVMFMMMSAQSGAGGNSRVMNFGKSRAKMTPPDEKSKKDVYKRQPWKRLKRRKVLTRLTRMMLLLSLQ